MTAAQQKRREIYDLGSSTSLKLHGNENWKDEDEPSWTMEYLNKTKYNKVILQYSSYHTIFVDSSRGQFNSESVVDYSLPLLTSRLF